MLYSMKREWIPLKYEFLHGHLFFRALSESLHHLDILVLYFFNIQIQNPLLDFLMPIITFAGTQIFWILTCLILYFIGGEKGKETAIICALALFSGYLVSEFLKSFFQVPRPFEVISWVRHLSNTGGYSFPSGHATAAFSGFFILGVKYGRLPIFVSLAIIVGISRIYMGIHYPSDIVAGALIGIACALISFKIEEKFLSFEK